MLSANKNNLTLRAKEEAKKILQELKIEKFSSTEDVGIFIERLDCEVAGLVSLKEEKVAIDDELLKTYDLLTDIAIDNESDLQFLNRLFFK